MPLGIYISFQNSKTYSNTMYTEDIIDEFNVLRQQPEMIRNSWFAISLSGCGTQRWPSTPAGSHNGTNNIFFCVVPPP